MQWLIELLVIVINSWETVNRCLTNIAQQLTVRFLFWRNFKQLWVLVHKRCWRISCTERWVRVNILQEWNIRLNPTNGKLVQGALHLINRFSEVSSVRHNLNQQRVKERRHSGTGVHVTGI